jgi:hypothetical protein
MVDLEAASEFRGDLVARMDVEEDAPMSEPGRRLGYLRAAQPEPTST